MSELVNRLRDRRQNVWEEAKGLADHAAEENRAFNGEEEAKWQALNSELDALDKRIKNVLDGERRAKETEDAFSALESGKGKAKERRGADGREIARRDAGDDSPEVEAFRKFARGEAGRFFEFQPSGRPIEARATLSTLTSAAGGATVPTSFYDRLVEHMIETSAVLRSGATILNTSGGEDLQVPKTTAHSSAVIVGETAQIPQDDPTFGQTVLGAFKYGLLIDVSRELIEDSGVDLEGYLARMAGRAVGNGFGEHAMVGDTSGNNPRGVVTDSIVAVTGAGPSPTAENLIDLKFSVIEPYRRNGAVWLMRDSSLAAIRKLRDESGGAAGTGQFLFQPSLVAGEPDMLLGHRIVTDPFVHAAAPGNRSVVFGDMSAYFVRLAGGVRFERSDDFRFDTDLVTFRALLRADGKTVDLTGAIKAFEGGGS